MNGELRGEIDGGQFNGTLTFDTPGCTAEREFSGAITAALLLINLS